VSELGAYVIAAGGTGGHIIPGIALADEIRAQKAGAEVVFPLADQFYGERGGRLRDPFGQQWMMSQHIEDVSPQEMSRRAAALFGR